MSHTTTESVQAEHNDDPGTKASLSKDDVDFADHASPHKTITSASVADYLTNSQIHKFATKGGHGFAAEEAHVLNDRLHGKTVEKTGTDNAKNGADRIVDGVKIQTKYCQSARETVNSAFGDDGMFRYPDMQFEVPKDQYEEAVERFREKIREGKVPGVTDPAEAESIVKKGEYTYQQAKNIAKAGNLDSLWFDLKNGFITGSCAFGIGFSITLARSYWHTGDLKASVREAAISGFGSAATSMAVGVISSQLMRTQLFRSTGTVAAKKVVREFYRTPAGKKLIDALAEWSLGRAVHGAPAINHVSRLLKSNVLTSVVTTVVVTTPDVYRAAISGNTSWAQVGKNLVVNAAAVGAGAAGGMLGAAATGAVVGSAVPGLGTAVGIAGGIAFGYAGGLVAKMGMDYLVKDDAEEMVEILNGVLSNLCSEYLVSQEELDSILELTKPLMTPELLRDMYGSEDREIFIREVIEPLFEVAAKARPIVPPTSDDEIEDIFIREMTELQAKRDKLGYIPDYILVGNLSATVLQLGPDFTPVILSDIESTIENGPTGETLAEAMGAAAVSNSWIPSFVFNLMPGAKAA